MYMIPINPKIVKFTQVIKLTPYILTCMPLDLIKMMNINPFLVYYRMIIKEKVIFSFPTNHPEWIDITNINPFFVYLRQNINLTIIYFCNFQLSRLDRNGLNLPFFVQFLMEYQINNSLYICK